MHVSAVCIHAQHSHVDYAGDNRYIMQQFSCNCIAAAISMLHAALHVFVAAAGGAKPATSQ
jgi:hypothetical protein